MRSLIVVSISLGMVFATSQPIYAQNSGGNTESGRVLAKAWCAECHRVEEGTFGVFAADFAEVAKLSSTTALSLRVFLQTNHREMPNFTLKPAESDDIIAYILSLKRKRDGAQVFAWWAGTTGKGPGLPGATDVRPCHSGESRAVRRADCRSLRQPALRFLLRRIPSSGVVTGRPS